MACVSCLAVDVQPATLHTDWCGTPFLLQGFGIDEHVIPHSSLAMFMTTRKAGARLAWKLSPNALPFPKGQPVFDSTAAWKLVRDGSALIYGEKANLLDHRYASVVARIAPGATEFLVRSRPGLNSGGARSWWELLDYPMGPVLTICHLAAGHGLMMHSCAVDDAGSGYLFTGNSGHGKSTMARLWSPHARVLNDEHVVIRRHDGGWWLHSTPWPGTFKHVTAEPVPLRHIFLLSHGRQNRRRHCSVPEGTLGLLRRCYPPIWDREGMQFTVDFCARIARDIPIDDLAFVPDARVLKVIRCAR